MEEIAEAVMRGLAGSTSPGIVSTLQMRSFVPRARLRGERVRSAMARPARVGRRRDGDVARLRSARELVDLGEVHSAGYDVEPGAVRDGALPTRMSAFHLSSTSAAATVLVPEPCP